MSSVYTAKKMDTYRASQICRLRWLVDAANSVPTRWTSSGDNTNDVGCSRGAEGKASGHNEKISRIINEALGQCSSTGFPQDHVEIISRFLNDRATQFKCIPIGCKPK